MSEIGDFIDKRRASMDAYKHEVTQVALKFDREMYVRFKSGCILRDTNPNRLLTIWIQRQVEAWHHEMRKELLPQPKEESP